MNIEEKNSKNNLEDKECVRSESADVRLIEVISVKSDPKLLRAEISSQLKQLLSLQEQRVRILNEFEINFKEYLLDAPDFDHAKLKLICKRVSEDLNEVSRRVLAIKRLFSVDCFDVANLYGLVDKLQSQEQLKFKLVLRKV